MRRTRALLLAISLAVIGCRRASQVAVAPPSATQPGASSPIMGPGTFSSGELGIALDYPAAWAMGKKKDFELYLFQPGKPEDRSISLDVPDLPFHIPGMIPVGSVQSGYLDDVKKQYSGVKVEQLTPPDLAKSSVRLVRCSGQSNARDMVELGLLVVHSDRVYIFRGTSDAAGEPEMRAAFDSIVKSIRWVKP